MHWYEVTGGVAAAAVPVCGLLWMLTKSTIREIVRSENAAQLEKINGTYTRSAGSRLTGYDIERRLDLAEERLDRAFGATHLGR